MIKIFLSDFEEKIKDIHNKTSFFNRPEEQRVRDIVKDVKENGNRALLKYIKEFEYPASIFLDLVVTSTELELAYSRIDQEILGILKRAIKNIRAYHEQFMDKSWSISISNNSSLGMRVSSLERVGVYVPGGTASYPSTVLMNVIPAQVAGVEQIVMATPAGKDGKVNDLVLAAAKELGITEIYRMGGAQAIAALAFGTEDLDPVDKIVGPGNIFVTLAKKEVFGVTGIDKLAGPSDICIVGDSLSNPRYIAADMLAQAEHDPLASAIFITDSNDLANKVRQEIEKQCYPLLRKDIINQSIANNSAIFVVQERDYQKIIELINLIAPEHLEVFHEAYKTIVQGVKNAGAIFVGEYSPEVLGDYNLGPNHVLPTGGTARFSSVLSAKDFLKASSLIFLDKKDFRDVGYDAYKLAELEGLDGHANAARIRL
ncbi:MAG: histidinol dehydrogenase [Candidatus Margulisbacteria bacterium]|nr:histidinol dehydrogenase [Candidatus Margulisiibacteriota bacterium]